MHKNYRNRTLPYTPRPSVTTQQQPAFALPKLNLPKSIIRDLSKPQYHNSIEIHSPTKSRALSLMAEKKHIAISSLLSSRVDFFNEKNSRRLKIHQTVKIEQLRPTKFKKHEIPRSKSLADDGARGKLVDLVERVFFPKVNNTATEGQYLPISTRIIQIDEGEEEAESEAAKKEDP